MAINELRLGVVLFFVLSGFRRTRLRALPAET